MNRRDLTRIFIRFYTRTYGWFHPIEKKVLFLSFSGKQYSDNPRAISEKLHELYPDYKIVWKLPNAEDPYGVVPSYVERVKPGKYAFYRELATSFGFVNNNANSYGYFKRRGQCFIQTWHGDRGFKRILYEAGQRNDNSVLEPYTDLAVCGSRLGRETYHTAFRYDGEIYSGGCPRNDILVMPDPQKARLVRERLGVSAEQKLFLFAPTYRDHVAEQNVEVDLASTVRALKEKYGGDWICLVRAHPGSGGLDLSGCSWALHVTDYPDMADLLLVSDFLITDYSSSAFDYYLTGRPCICALFDYDDYVAQDRGFKVRPEDSGIPIARDQQELEKIIREYSDEDYQAAYQKVTEVYGTTESGAASEQICRYIQERWDKRVSGKK